MSKQVYTIDIGNSSIKVGLFDGETFSKVHKADPSEVIDLSFPAIVSNVRKTSVNIIAPRVFETASLFKNGKFLDMNVHYSETLGNDRIVAAYEAYKCLSKNERSLVIDAGTFLTVDVVSVQGFEGGFILPGIDLIQGCYDSGELLQNPEEVVSFNKSIIPKNTAEAISLGAQRLVASTLEDIVNTFSIDSVFLTGGSIEALKPLIPGKVTRYLRGMLVHEGLLRTWQHAESIRLDKIQ